MFHNLNLPGQPLVLVTDNNFMPAGIISNKIIMVICHQIYTMFYPFIVNLMNYSNIFVSHFVKTLKNILDYSYNSISNISNISNILSTTDIQVTDKMNMSYLLFYILVLSFIAQTIYEFYMLCNYLYSSTIEKKESEMKTIKNKHYAKLEVIDYKLHAMDLALAKVNRRVRALEKANKLYNI
jgi:hypothetical protein